MINGKVKSFGVGRYTPYEMTSHFVFIGSKKGSYLSRQGLYNIAVLSIS